MRNKIGMIAAVVIFAALQTMASAASITDLGTLPGDTISKANGINNIGQIVGISSSFTTGIVEEEDHPTMWTRNGTGYSAQRLPGFPCEGGITPPDCESGGAAFAINDFGQIVGVSTNSSGDHAVLWNKNGSNYDIIDLGELPNNYKSIASDINNLGQIVGYSARDNSGAEIVSPVLWTRTTTIIGGTGTNYFPVDIGNLPNEANALAKSINNVGQIVGNSYNSSTLNFVTLWNRVSIISPIYNPTLLQGLGLLDREANDINNFGQIVGSSDNSSGFRHAVSWTKTTTIIGGTGTSYFPVDLGTLGSCTSDGFCSAAIGINDLGQIVGYSEALEYVGGPVSFTPALFDHAVKWNKIGVLSQTYSITDIGTLPGGKTSRANDINNLGQIVGLSTSNNLPDNYHAVLWQP